MCEYCVRGEDNVCARKGHTCALGSKGGLADFIRIDSAYAVPIPDALSSEVAAPLLCAGITVYAPLVLHTRPADTIGIVGIGGLGHLALQFAKARGHSVVAFSRGSSKQKEAMSFGAHTYVDSGDNKAMQKARNTVDVMLITTDAAMDFKPYIDAINRNGKLIFLGAPLQPLKLHAAVLVNKQIWVTGSSTGPRWVMQEMMEFAARHNIRAATEVFSIAQVNEGIQRLRAGHARYRIVAKL